MKTALVLLSLVSGLSDATAAGLDVQLKDLRGAFYYTKAQLTSGAKDCIKLTGPEVKKFGRLTHCKPEEKFVECHAKGGDTLFVFEQSEACTASLKTGVAPVPEEI